MIDYNKFEQLANEGILLKNKDKHKTLTLFQYKTGISNWSDPTIRQSLISKYDFIAEKRSTTYDRVGKKYTI